VVSNLGAKLLHDLGVLLKSTRHGNVRDAPVVANSSHHNEVAMFAEKRSRTAKLLA
jgi:hypothetical protein